MFNFGWLAQLFRDRAAFHCSILPNHRPRKDGDCSRLLLCQSEGFWQPHPPPELFSKKGTSSPRIYVYYPRRAMDPRCLQARERAFALGDGFMAKKGKGRKKLEETTPVETTEETTTKPTPPAPPGPTAEFNAKNVLNVMKGLGGKDITTTQIMNAFGLKTRGQARRMLQALVKDGKVSSHPSETKKRQVCYDLV